MIHKRLSCNGKVLAHNIIYCDTILRQGTGLMFRPKGSVKDTAWWFRFRSPRRLTVTMFFVFFSIDVLFIGKDGRISEIRKDLKPFTNYPTKGPVYGFVELEQGSVRKNSIKVGMKLSSR